MYKAFTSLWFKPSSKKGQLSSDLSIDEDSWVFVTESAPPTIKHNHLMTNSWIEPIPSQKTDESTANVHHFNPIENLLRECPKLNYSILEQPPIEHASMSVYEQIASKTRTRRPRKFVYDDEQVEEGDEDEEDDDDHDGRISVNRHHPNLTSVHHRNMNISSNSFTTTLESSTLSLAAHHRHLQRLHQRRKRTNKSASKLAVPNTVDEQPKQEFNENVELKPLNYTNTAKIFLQPPSHTNN
ncbi:unnamed protein product [Rotaria socialis]|uniref:Uncharacterized protein n=1 Tax=Rotaria socialis TaxID=392032 RepID=A0A818GCR4_9BILA|nr:unnamed protein product [Rotaria socialis]